MTTGPAGPEAQPTVTTYELGDLVMLAWQGRIRVPRFQRDFRWRSEDVLRLFDSVVKGYPIGNLLLWVRPHQSEEEPEEFMLGRLKLTAPPPGESLWVVDGQQRLSSLANALSPEGHRYMPFAVYYDLAAKEFVESPKSPEPYQVPLPVLFDARKLLTWFRTDGFAASEHSEQFDEAVRVAEALRQYRIPVTLVRGGETVVTDIFDRMNNYGRRLSRVEIFTALHTAQGQDSDERPPLERISDNVAARTGFGSIDTGTVLAAVLSRRGPDPFRDIRTEFAPAGGRTRQEFPDEDVPTAYAQGEEALVRAVGFVIQHAGVPHVSLLPYRFLLVTLTRFFAHFPQPQPNNLRLLRRLFWRYSIIGQTGSASSANSSSRTLGARIRPGDEEGSLHAMLDTLADTSPVMPSAERFRANEATAKIILSAWWSLRPRSLTTGEVLDGQSLAALLGLERTATNATPLIYPRLSDARSKLLPANRLLLPTASDPVSEIPALLSHQQPGMDDTTWNSVLASHLLDEEVAARAETDHDAFLRMRQERVVRQLDIFLRRMAEWYFEDTPSLNTFDLDDEFEEPQESGLPAAPKTD